MEGCFRPTLQMRRMKAALHRNCPPNKLQTLVPTDADIWRYIAPIRVQFLNDCIKEYGEDFWLWLLTPDDEDGKREMLMDTAKDILDRILQMDMYDAAGNVNTKLVQVIAHVALEVLKLSRQESPLVQVMQVNAQQDMPKGLRGKSSVELEDRLRTMLKHLPPEEQTEIFQLEGAK